MPKSSPAHRRRRRKGSILQEATRLGGIALLSWLVVGASLAWLVSTVAESARPPVISRQMRQTAARLVHEPAVAAALSMWWGTNDEPIDGLAVYREPRPTPSPIVPPTPTPKLPAVSQAPIGNGIFLPILYYHHPPADFEVQLEHLEAHGYHVVSLDTALAGLAGGPLPSRPVVITFDDGFADQIHMIPVLQRHHATATFYIINGGDASNWCIGSGRRYNDPGQPPQGCGDAYLTWDQVRELDRSGVASIGGHTLDHPNLALLPAEVQFKEIAESKAGIEQQIGHSISHFAYPYGSYSGVTITEVQRAGYQDAVSTAGGTYQSLALRWNLLRLNSAYTLPN